MALTSSDNFLISSSIVDIGRLRSLPRVKGTMQKLHILSQPRIIELTSRQREKGNRIVSIYIYWPALHV